MPKDDDLRLYTLREVAELLRLPYELVRDSVYSGAWPHRAFSARNRRMSADDIRAVIAAHAAPVAQADLRRTDRSAAHLRRRRLHELLR